MKNYFNQKENIKKKFQNKKNKTNRKMSYMLPHLFNGWQVDQAILSEEDKVVIIRFGHDWDPTCMKMDEVRLMLFYVK